MSFFVETLGNIGYVKVAEYSVGYELQYFYSRKVGIWFLHKQSFLLREEYI
jgi:hypothetical protein